MTTESLNREQRRKVAKTAKVTSPAEFRKKSMATIQLPSGNYIKCARPGMAKFLEAGFLPDPLAKLIAEEIKTKSARSNSTEKALADAASNPAMVAEIMRSMDRVAASAIMEPTTVWHERPVLGEDGQQVKREDGSLVYEDIPLTERDESVLYTDELEMADKMFIFQYAVGGSSDLSRFRQQSHAVVDALQPSGAVVETTE